MRENPMDRGMREYETLRAQGEQEAAGAQARTGGIYDALQRELAQAGAGYQPAAQGIQSGLQAALGQLAGQLGQPVPAGEGQAAGALMGGIGGGGLGVLAADQARNLGFQTSAVRQGGIQRQTGSRVIEQGLRDYLESLKSQLPGRVDELRDQAFGQQMSLQEYRLRQAEERRQRESDKALTQYLVGKSSKKKKRKGKP